MENVRFKEVPVLNALTLPFVAKDKHLEEWLRSLANFPDEVAAEKILYACQAIGQIEGKADSQLRLLQKLLQNFHTLVEPLQKIYLDASQPLDERAMRHVELVVWNYIQPARMILAIVRQHQLKLTKEQYVLALYLGMEALNYAQLHIALSYRLPMAGFWTLCYQIYRYAEQANLLSVEVNRREYSSVDTLRDESGSIEKSFKQLLLFNLSDTRQFRCRDMLMVFHYLTGFSMSSGILSGYQPAWQQGVCVFNLNLDQPPQRIFEPATGVEPLERFIAPIAVAKSMYETLQQNSKSALHRLNYDVLLRAINTLGLGRKRKFKRISEHSECTGIIGLKDVISFLQSKVELNITPESVGPKLDQPKPIGIWQTREFDLVAAGDEVINNLRQAYRKDIQQETAFGKLLKFGAEAAENRQNLHFSLTATPVSHDEAHLSTFEVQDTSAKGYGLVTKLPNVNAKIGDVLGIIKENSLNVELGLIRRISQIPAQRLGLGVEMIGFKAELALVSYADEPPAEMIWAMFLPGVDAIKQPDSLVYSSSLLKLGAVVTIQRQNQKQQYQLQKILQVTSAVVHMELLPLEPKNRS